MGEAFGSEGASIDDPVKERDFTGNTKRISDISILTKIASEIDLEPIDPAGTVEAPILEAEEFVVRLQPIAERTSGHWNELEKMLEGQSGREKEADSSTKIQQQ